MSSNRILKTTFKDFTFVGLLEPKADRQTIISLQGKDKDLINFQDHDGENGLLLAAEHGNYEIIKAMVQSKEEKVKNEFETATCNKNDENALHLSKFNQQMINL